MQKRFRITTSGERELDRWLRTVPDGAPPPRDELVIKVQVALRMPGVDVREKILQVHRRHVVEEMQRYTHLKAEAAADDVGLGLVVDAELFRLEAVVRWLDAADARLRRLPASPLVAADADTAASDAADPVHPASAGATNPASVRATGTRR